MDFLLASLRKDLSRWRRDAAAIALWMLIPLVIGSLITSLVDGGDGVKPKGLLLIADQDETVLSGFVSSAYTQGELAELITVEPVTAEDGRKRIDAGEASGFLVIPAGFTDAFLDSAPVMLQLFTNPSQTILPGIITDVTEILLDLGFYAEQLFGDEIREIQAAVDSDGVSEAFVAALSVQFQQKIEAAAPQLFPPAIDIEIAEPPADEPSLPFSLLFLPGIILMALMFAANGLAGDYWKERELGTLRRLAQAPARAAGFLAGKALAAFLILAIISVVALLIGFIYHDIPLTRLPSALAWTTVSGLGLFAWFGALQMMAPTQHSANLITSMLLFPMLMAGGSFFPFAALPDWIAAIGRRTPNGFVVDRLTSEITAAGAWAIDPQSWLTVAAMVLSGLALCAWRLRTGFARG
ncbi:MAG: ABC transporter permease [Xanthomonadales bacterium]|nr:ABC transporter permease [Xanthomonadales bacterium]